MDDFERWIDRIKFLIISGLVLAGFLAPVWFLLGQFSVRSAAGTNAGKGGDEFYRGIYALCIESQDKVQPVTAISQCNELVSGAFAGNADAIDYPGYISPAQR